MREIMRPNVVGHEDTRNRFFAEFVLFFFFLKTAYLMECRTNSSPGIR